MKITLFYQHKRSAGRRFLCVTNVCFLIKSALPETGFRNIHGFVWHQSENFFHGMPGDLSFRSAVNADINEAEAILQEMYDNVKNIITNTKTDAWLFKE